MGTQIFKRETKLDPQSRDYCNPILREFYDAVIWDMLLRMGAAPGATVLDAGCGSGAHSIRVSKLGCKVCAVDLSPLMLNEAAANAAKAGAGETIQFRCENLTSLSFPDRHFAHAFSWAVLIHIRDVEKAIHELVRVLKPSGTLAISVNNRNAVDYKIGRAARVVLHRPVRSVRLSLGVGAYCEMNGEKLWMQQFDIQSLIEEFEKSGMLLIDRYCGEFTELQRRAGGMLRNALLRFNNFAYQIRVTPTLARTNILIFRKK